MQPCYTWFCIMHINREKYQYLWQKHATTFLFWIGIFCKYATTKMIALNLILSQTEKLGMPWCHLLLVTSDVSPHLHTLLQKWVLSLCGWGDRRKRCAQPRDVALPQGAPVPPPALVHGGEEVVSGTLSPYQLVSVLIAWLETSERWGIYTQCPACASGIVSRAVVNTYYSSCLLSYECEAAVSKRAEDIFASSSLQPPPDRNRGICKSWHISSSWALVGGKSHRARCKGRQEC